MSKACCGFDRGRHHAGQHDAVRDRLDAHIAVRKHLLERAAHAVEIARHRDVEAGELAAVGIEEIDVGLADADADQIGAPRGADHRIGDLGIGHQDVLDVARQIDDHRLADPEGNEIRAELRCHDLDAGVRWRRRGALRRDGQVERDRSENHLACQPGRGAAERPFRHRGCPLRHRHFAIVVVVTPNRTMFMRFDPPEILRRRRRLALGGIGIHEAAQRERQGALLAPHRQRFGLTRRQFQRRGLADHDALTVLFLDGLIDREHRHVAQQRLRHDRLDAGEALRLAVAPGEDDVDPVVRQDEPSGTGFRRDFGRDGPHAGRQNGRHVAGALRLDELAFAQRLAAGDRHPRDRAGELLDGVGTVGLAHEQGARRGGRPGDPTHVLRQNGLADIDVLLGDEDVHRIDRDDGYAAQRVAAPLTCRPAMRRRRRPRPQCRVR